MLKRHEVKILLKAGHGKAEVARLAGVCLCSVKRIAQEGPVVHVDDHAERAKRQIGRPSTVVTFRKQSGDSARAARIGFAGDSAASARGGLSRRQERAVLAGSFAARPKPVKPWVGFEGLPGEFSQHDFGQVDVEFLNGTRQRIHSFRLSRLKYSRGVRVSLVKAVETLVRTLAEHLASWGGRPLLCVFD